MALTYLIIALALTLALPASSFGMFFDPKLGRAARDQEVSQTWTSSEEFPDQVQGGIASDKLTYSGEELTQLNSQEQLTQMNSGEQLTQTNGQESLEKVNGESSEESPDPSLSFSQWSEPPKPIVVPYKTKKSDSIEQVTEPQITKGEVEREVELILSQEYAKAEEEKGEPLTKQEIHRMEEELEQKPWYRRLAHAVKHRVINPAGKWLSDTFGKRQKRIPNWLIVST